MFASGTFRPTYFGPIQASGDVLRRTRNTGMAQAEFSGNQRNFGPSMQGVSSGSGARMYQRGVQSDFQRSKGMAEAQDAIADFGQNQADAQFAYQTGAAGEQAGIRDLMLARQRYQQGARLDLRKLAMDADLATRQRDAQNKANDLANSSRVSGFLSNLIF